MDSQRTTGGSVNAGASNRYGLVSDSTIREKDSLSQVQWSAV